MANGSVIGAGGEPAWNWRVNSPGPGAGGLAAGGGGAAIGSAIGAGGAAVWNWRVNSPGVATGSGGAGAGGGAAAGGGTFHVPTCANRSGLGGGANEPSAGWWKTHSRSRTTPGEVWVTTHKWPSNSLNSTTTGLPASSKARTRAIRSALASISSAGITWTVSVAPVALARAANVLMP